MSTTQLTILRHGEVQGGKIFRGSQDDPLSENGWNQMQLRLSNIDIVFDRVISSPLKRCVYFAEHYSKTNQLPLDIVSAFKEIDFGTWEGKSYAQLTESDKSLLDQFYRDPLHHTPPEGETLSAFRERVIRHIKLAMSRSKGKSLLLISHAGVQKIILCHALQMPIQAMHHIDTPYAGITQLSLYNQDEGYWLLNKHG